MTVLLAYSRTPEGDAALHTALAEARRRDTNVLVVDVTPTGEDDSPFSAEQTLDAVAALFHNSGVEVEIRQLAARPDAADTILDVVDETKPEVVVIGLRRRSRVGKFVLGSTTQRILQDVDCPILAVKAHVG